MTGTAAGLPRSAGVPRAHPPAPPAADRPVDAESVAALCSRLAAEPGVDLRDAIWAIGPSPLGEGWDNVLWPVGTLDGRRLVLRVPRRESAVDLLQHEMTVLRALAASDTRPAVTSGPLPMQVPAPLAASEDAALIVWVEGRTAAKDSEPERRVTARQLAEMLARVHRTPSPLGRCNPVRGVALADRADAMQARLDVSDLPSLLRDRARARMLRGFAAPTWSGPDLLLHGDPHPGNVIVGQGRGRATLIDWGDTTAGDPASDLGALLLHDPRDAILEHYRTHAELPGDDEPAWSALADRAWAWGASLALVLLSAYPSTHVLGRAGRRLLEAA